MFKTIVTNTLRVLYVILLIVVGILWFDSIMAGPFEIQLMTAIFAAVVLPGIFIGAAMKKNSAKEEK